ncbi:MAG: esterase [Kangiella sp.]|nr:MAG: esterase [Kangiella sp.]
MIKIQVKNQFKILVMISCGILMASCNKDKRKVASATSNVKIIEQAFEMPGLNRNRKLRLYLPPDYEKSTKRYPVLYMHDGQNLFDDLTSFVGEWGIDESLNELYKKNEFSIIVVGVDNGAEKRMNELSPWMNSKYGVAEGKQYMEFIVNTVKPYIDNHYRTLTDRNNTAIMGSSMGGLISHYAMFEYPTIFSKAGVFSPSFWFAKEVYPFSDKRKLLDNHRLYYLMGGDEGQDTVENMDVMVASLITQGVNSESILSRTVDGGEHNERFWRSEFTKAVTWLFR